MSTYAEARKSGLSWLSAAWTTADPNLKRIVAVNFIEALSVSLYASVLMPYYRSLGYGSQVAGALTSVLQVVAAVVGVAAGFLADSLGRKRLFTAGQLLRCAAAGLLLVTRSYAGLVLVSAVRGLAVVQSPAQSAMMASYTRRENRGTLYGLASTVGMVAQVTGPLVAGIIADRSGVKTAFGAGLALACLAVFAALPLRERPAVAQADPSPLNAIPVASPDPSADSRDPVEKPWSRVARMFREGRPVVLTSLFLTAVLNGMGNGAANILLPFTIMDRFSSAYTTVASSQSVGSVGTMLVLLIGGRIADVYGRRGLVLTSSAIFPILMLGLFMVGSLWQLFAVLILITMVGNISSPAIGAVQMEAVGERDRATFAGLHLGLNSAGMALGMVGGGIAYKMSPDLAWMAVIALFALQLPLYALAIPRAKLR
jgi:MFS family permease